VQSFRRHDVPAWIGDCMAGVQRWAASRNFEYRMLGDEFLELVPHWYRAKAHGYITVVADLARLVLIRRNLELGYDRVLWIDADVVVFDPSALSVDVEAPYAYSREVWVERSAGGALKFLAKVNNSACLFSNSREAFAHLNGYIARCKSTIAGLRTITDHTIVGTRLLTALNRKKPLPILPGFALFSPAILEAILESNRSLLMAFAKLHEGRIGAANLCNFLKQWNNGINDEMASAVLARLAANQSLLALDRGFPMHAGRGQTR